MRNVVIYTSHLIVVKSQTPHWAKNVTRIRQTKCIQNFGMKTYFKLALGMQSEEEGYDRMDKSNCGRVLSIIDGWNWFRMVKSAELL